MNDQKIGRRNYGTEGLHKSEIDKWKSLRIENSLTEDRKKHLIIH